jgi:large subunit ribosomal protein L32
MGALPKKKHTVHRQGRRRADIKLIQPTMVKCASCGTAKVAHRQCKACGK